MAGLLAEGVAYGLLQRFDEPGLPSLYHPPGLLRPWLAAPERLAADDARAVHARLAAFWRSSRAANRENELRVAIDAELDACREHARQAEDGPTFRWSTVILARLLTARSEWNQARFLLEEVAEGSRDTSAWYQLATVDLYQGIRSGAGEVRRDNGDRGASATAPARRPPRHQLASIDLNQGDCAAAREKFVTVMEIRRAIGDRAGEAAAWHQLASIDLNQGDYAAAQEKFATVMEIRRAIGDRAGEANVLHQLATIASTRGNMRRRGRSSPRRWRSSGPSAICRRGHHIAQHRLYRPQPGGLHQGTGKSLPR